MCPRRHPARRRSSRARRFSSSDTSWPTHPPALQAIGETGGSLAEGVLMLLLGLLIVRIGVCLEVVRAEDARRLGLVVRLPVHFLRQDLMRLRVKFSS